MLTPLRYRLERLQHRQGELLRSADFRDQQTVEAELRWWHNRSLHNTYGIACGLAATQNGTQVMIAPGLAYDCFGRELLLPQPTELTLPAQPATVKLLMRYRETSTASCAPPVASCRCSDGANLPEGVDFRWVDAARTFDPRDGVLLPRSGVDVSGFTLPREPVQPRARALSRPRIATGSTSPGSGGWESWMDPRNPAAALGFQITIDTSAAGFTRPPCYFASLEGPRWVVVVKRSGTSAPSQVLLSDHVANATATGFMFRVFVRDSGPEEQKLAVFQAFACESRLSVHWLGIQDDGRQGS